MSAKKKSSSTKKSASKKKAIVNKPKYSEFPELPRKFCYLNSVEWINLTGKECEVAGFILSKVAREQWKNKKGA